MQLLAEEQGDCLVVTVAEDRIDAGSAVQFKEAMRTAIEGESPRVVLDLSSVDSIDSSGLGAIVAVMKFLGSGRKLELAGLSDKVQTVFRLTRMDSVVTIHETRDAAAGPVARVS